MSHGLGEAFWEEQYRGRAAHHQPRPNANLVSEATDLATGRALDAGCGEGADAIWLASRGWQVTAVDFASTALERARANAADLDTEVAGRIDWVHADLTACTPPAGRFDLVSAQYVHVPDAARGSLFQRLAAAVAPGGTLLVAGHHPSDLDTTVARGEDPGLYVTTEQIAASLDPDRWEIVVAESRSRTESDHHGHGEVAVQDTVLRAHRIQSP